MKRVEEVRAWLENKCVSNDADAFIIIGWLKAKYGEGKYGFKMIWKINVIKNRAAVGADQYIRITLGELVDYVHCDQTPIVRGVNISIYDMYEDIEELKSELAKLRHARKATAAPNNIEQYIKDIVASGDPFNIHFRI